MDFNYQTFHLINLLSLVWKIEEIWHGIVCNAGNLKAEK